MFLDAAQDDDKLPPDQWRECPRCLEQFWSVVLRARPTFVSLFCAKCEGAITREREERLARLRLTHEFIIRHGAGKWRRKEPPMTLESLADAALAEGKKGQKRP